MRTLADYAFPGAPDPLDLVDFVTYDPATGLIVKHGQIQRIAFDSYVERGDPILAGEGEPLTHRVDLATLEIVPLAAYEEPQMELPL